MVTIAPAQRRARDRRAGGRRCTEPVASGAGAGTGPGYECIGLRHGAWPASTVAAGQGVSCGKHDRVFESIRRWLSQLFGSSPPTPQSEPGHGVSSFHLWWQGIDGGAPLVEVAATIEVLRQPAADRLYFWALQTSFISDRGTHGAAHIGLQWNPRHPGSKAVNWGGYADAADVRSILDGTPSSLPSTPSDPD